MCLFHQLSRGKRGESLLPGAVKERPWPRGCLRTVCKRHHSTCEPSYPHPQSGVPTLVRRLKTQLRSVEPRPLHGAPAPCAEPHPSVRPRPLDGAPPPLPSLAPCAEPPSLSRPRPLHRAPPSSRSPAPSAAGGGEAKPRASPVQSPVHAVWPHGGGRPVAKRRRKRSGRNGLAHTSAGLGSRGCSPFSK